MSPRAAGEYSLCLLLALCMAGGVSLGMVCLTEIEEPKTSPLIEGAIRLAAPEPDQIVEEKKERLQDEPEPPKDLDLKFTANPTSKQQAPVMQMRIPAFAADIHPSLSDGINIPTASLGSMGFNINEVDDVPQVLRSVPPEYPYAAKRSRTEGNVVIRLLVKKDGKPDNLSIHSSSPVGIFDSAALSAAVRWRFKPGRYAGNDVDTWVLIPFNFEMTQ
ncbi:energy transducer TonB [Desulfovibrio sp. JC010]|uniref:energy transducer TonB n=1 Tax=Desulfovibrio sp. JC010 TaxID=2593641 RepID=UPI001EF1658F|nr:energy transducer TonB [Desulfovibrio sp. JC010]